MTILDDFYDDHVFIPKYKYDESGIYHQLEPSSDHEVSGPLRSFQIKYRMSPKNCSTFD